MSVTKALLAESAREASHTRRLLELVPARHLAWRPQARSMTLGRLAGHIAEIPGWAGQMMSDGLDLAAGPFYTPFEPTSLGQLLVEFGSRIGDFHRALDGVTDADLAAPWTLRRGERMLVTQTREAAIRTYVLSHVVHHRGQLTVFLRMLDVALPQTYGPTADHSGFTVEETESRRAVGRVLEESLLAAV